MKNIRSIFPTAYRASGVVLDIAALPSRFGIGDVGPSALSWVDRLRCAEQSWWHAIERESPRSCDSVNDSRSSFAISELLISPDWLIEDGLLSPRDCEIVKFAEGSIDYDVVVPFKHWLLEKAWKKFEWGARKDLRPCYEQFKKKQKHWLEDYALFRALKMKYRGAPYVEWPVDLVARNQATLAAARRELTGEIDQIRFSQFLLSRQIKRLKEYANNRGVRLIGDSPFFISADSSEVWAYPELFVRDEKFAQGAAADLVPVCFSSSDGFGPDSDRAALSRVSYRWCADRLRVLLTQVDVARVDVRVLAAPRHAPGGALANRIREGDGDFNLAAVKGLTGNGLALDRTGGFAFHDRFYIPEIRPLQFGFDGRSDHASIAQTGTSNSVLYTGLPDGSSVREWFNELPDDHRGALWAYLKRPADESEVALELIRMAWSSGAALAMVSFPDLLNLERDPARIGDLNNGHRRWRCSEAMLSTPALYWLRELTRESTRSADRQETPSPAKRRSSRTPPRIEAAL